MKPALLVKSRNFQTARWYSGDQVEAAPSSVFFHFFFFSSSFKSHYLRENSLVKRLLKLAFRRCFSKQHYYKLTFTSRVKCAKSLEMLKHTTKTPSFQLSDSQNKRRFQRRLLSFTSRCGRISSSWLHLHVIVIVRSSSFTRYICCYCIMF